jgi:hypothetical protein
MASIDSFKGTDFDMRSMTASINKQPYNPGIIGKAGLFKVTPITTTIVEVVRSGGKIALLPTKPRGAQGTVHNDSKAKSRIFQVPHIPYDGAIYADSIQNARDYETENDLMAVGKIVNAKLAAMRQDHEVTHEYHRVGAIKGVVLDADGSTTIYDLFSEFGISQTSVDFLLGTAGTSVKAKVEEVKRAMDTALGNLAYSGIQAYCGDSFWDKLVAHASVTAAFDRWNDGQFFRESQRGEGFEFLGVYWKNYRGKVGSVDFIPTADCRFVPLGVNDLFLEHYAPADMMDTVNTMGKPVYALQEPKPMNKGVDIHTQSNPLMICTRPEVLIRGTTSN